MDGIIAWLGDNKEWVFSGIGGTVIALMVGWLLKKRQIGSSQTIRSGSNSTNYQSGGDININKMPKKDDVGQG